MTNKLKVLTPEDLGVELQLSGWTPEEFAKLNTDQAAALLSASQAEVVRFYEHRDAVMRAAGAETTGGLRCTQAEPIQPTQPTEDEHMKIADRVKELKQRPMFAGRTEKELEGDLKAAMNPPTPWAAAIAKGKQVKAETTTAATPLQPWTNALKAEKEAA